jgi:hypothetical protein
MINELMESSKMAEKCPLPSLPSDQTTLCLSCKPSPAHSGLGRSDLFGNDLDIPGSPISMSSAPTSPTPDPYQDDNLLSLPTKVKELSADLVTHGPNEKRYGFP